METNIKWWNGGDVRIVLIDGKYIAISEYNGEIYRDCWEVEEVKNDTAYGIKEDGLEVIANYDDESEEYTYELY